MAFLADSFSSALFAEGLVFAALPWRVFIEEALLCRRLRSVSLPRAQPWREPDSPTEGGVDRCRGDGPGGGRVDEGDPTNGTAAIMLNELPERF
jgi:hypothetical protein